MRSNPINLLLTGIAVADMMVMVEYIPFALHMYLLQNRNIEVKVYWYRTLFIFTMNYHD